jgi:hypothetical protein
MNAPDLPVGRYISSTANVHRMQKAIALFFVLLFLAPYAAADGMMFIADRDMWYLQPEVNQMAAIHYEDGMENMLISVSPGSDFKGDRAVWVFPVPAAPETVKIDLLKGYPRYTGRDFLEQYTGTVAMAAAASVLYATFPVSIISGGAAFLSAFVFGMAGNISKSSDIQVYDRVEKMGVVTEVVAARDAAALDNFLLLRGMTPTAGGRELLGSYIGQNYTFVVTSIANVTQYREATQQNGRYYDYYSGMAQANMIGVFVRFPADRIYFPLKPTAVYGSREVPVLLYVTGYVSPVLYDSIRDRTGVTYYTEAHYEPPVELQPFFNMRTEFDQLKYTKIKITARSDRFTGDLWIDPSPPADMVVKEAFLDLAIPVTAMAYIIFSAIASLLAGIIAFRKKAADKKRLLLHGLWNSATFIGLALATRRAFPQEEYGKRTPYLLMFYGIFGLLFSIFTVMLAPSLAFGVMLGWGAALLSPLISLALLAFIPMIFGGIYNLNAFSLMFALVVSAVLIVLALCPVPCLLWLKRWMDPEPGVPGPGLLETLADLKRRGIPEIAALADYEKRWGRVAVAFLALTVLGSLLHATPFGPVCSVLGFWGFLCAVLFYAASIFDRPEPGDRLRAISLILVPLVVYAFLTMMPSGTGEWTATLIACLIITGIILGGTILLRRLVLYRSVRGPPVLPARPDPRMVLLVLLVTSLIMTPPVIGLLGMDNPRASFMTGKGDDFAADGKYEAAREAYYQAIMADPQYAPAFEHRGDMELNRGNCYQARTDYELALMRTEHDPAIQAKLQKAGQDCGGTWSRP